MFREYCFDEYFNAITRRMMKMSQRKKTALNAICDFHTVLMQ